MTLSSEQMIEWLREYAAERINSRLIDERRCIPPYVVLDFGRQGLLGMEVPKEFGGGGYSTTESLKVFEQLAAIDLTLASFVAVHHALGTRPVRHFGTPEAKAELLPNLASGRELGAFAITEPGAGSDPRSLSTTARPDGSGAWLLRGRKSWIGNGSWAGVTHVFAKEVDGAGNLIGMTGFAVRQRTKGLRQGPESLTMGVRGMVQNTIFLDDARVTAPYRLGAPQRGFDVAEDAMSYGRLGLGVMSVGGMKRCAQLMLRYASRRTISSGPLVDNPVTLARLGELTAVTTALEAFAYRIAEVRDAGGRVQPELYMACKVAGPEWLFRAADWLIQLLGGRGYIETNVAPQLFRDARLFRVFEGPTETLLSAVGSRVLSGLSQGLDALFEPFQAPAAGSKLAARLERVAGSYAAARAASESMTHQRWFLSQAGEVTVLSLLHAAVLHAEATRPRAGLLRSREWLEHRLDEMIAAIERRALWEPASLDRAWIARLIEGYEGQVGDIEQSLPGECVAVAEELLRTPGADENAAAELLAREAEPVVTRPSAEARASAQEAGSTPSRDRETVETWLIERVAAMTGSSEDEIDTTTPFFEFGFDSNAAVAFSTELSAWLGRRMDPTIAWDYPTIEALAEYLTASTPSLAVTPEEKTTATDDIALLLARELLVAEGVGNGK